MTSAAKDTMPRAARSQILRGVVGRIHEIGKVKCFLFVVRFNRIAWGKADGSRPEGIIAAGMENGELGIWDPSKIVAHVKYVFILLISAVVKVTLSFQHS
jgi:hypothetical protein